jgi:hypothetical protein
MGGLSASDRERERPAIGGASRPLIMQIEAADRRARLRADGEELALVDASDIVEPDLSIRSDGHTIEEFLRGGEDRFSTFGDAEVAAGDEWFAPLPAAESSLLAGGEFETVPGATLVAALHVDETAWGEVVLVERWNEGQLVASGVVSPDRFDEIPAELRMNCTLSQLVALRRREITPPDALAAGARLDTAWPYMACYFGLIQHAAFAQAYAQLRMVDSQVTWGRLLSDASQRESAVEAVLRSSS